jgi:hypothetical protein
MVPSVSERALVLPNSLFAVDGTANVDFSVACVFDAINAAHFAV